MSGAESASERTGLVIQGLTKAYGPTRALRGLSLAVLPGQIVGIVGPNGAGKSTLVKILAGEEHEDGGEIRIGDRALSPEIRRRSVAVVHQEPQLFPNLTVAENLLIDARGMQRPRPTRDVYRLLDGLQIGKVANSLLENSSIVVWQLTEIARAVLREAEIFLFDEPNSALTKEESERLFQQMTALRDAGKFVFLVSHRLGDVAQVCGSVAVVRDGLVVASLSGPEVTSERLATLLIAEEFGSAQPESHPSPSERVAPARTRPERVGTPTPPRVEAVPAPADARRDATMAASRIAGFPGVVVAVTGPEGGGGRELTRAAALVGAVSPPGGHEGGRAYMPSDRRHSLFFNMSVAANISSRLARRYLPGQPKLLSRRALAKAAEAFIERFNIKAEHAGASIGSLSGGNQQKVALAAALAVDPSLLIIEEPTRGVDIRTKIQIYDILRAFTESGGAVVMYVTELEDALGCADHLFVVSDGRVRGRLAVDRTGDLEDLGADVNRLLTAGVNAA